MNAVYVIGSINNDVVVTTTHHPRTGETIAGSNLQTFPGGKGANQAVAASLAGAKTTMIGLVGNDAAGQSLIDFMSSKGVETSKIGHTPKAPTGTALITVANGDNTIVVVPGANSTLTTDNLTGFAPQEGDAVVAQFETPQEVTVAAFERAQKAGAKTILNPAPASVVSDELLSLTDFIIVNEHEHKLIFGSAPDTSGNLTPPPKHYDLFWHYHCYTRKRRRGSMANRNSG